MLPLFSPAPSASNDDASSSRPLFHQGGLDGAEQYFSTAMLSKLLWSGCDESASQAHRGSDLSRAVFPYSHPLQLEQGVALVGLSGAHFDGIFSTT